MTLQNRTLFFGDNLQVIEEKIPENFFDLIYLDPPFNSNRNYNVLDGIPMDYESAQALSVKDKFAFQDWAITLVGATPPSGVTKKGADRGIDGLILFRDKVDYANPKLRKILVQVKGGGSGRGDVAKLKGDIEREDAPMGILITLNEPTAEMKREAALAGEYKYTESSLFPRIQILSIRDWFAGKEARIPSDKISPFKNAEAKGNQPSLL